MHTSTGLKIDILLNRVKSKEKEHKVRLDKLSEVSNAEYQLNLLQNLLNLNYRLLFVPYSSSSVLHFALFRSTKQ